MGRKMEEGRRKREDGRWRMGGGGSAERENQPLVTGPLFLRLIEHGGVSSLERNDGRTDDFERCDSDDSGYAVADLGHLGLEQGVAAADALGPDGGAGVRAGICGSVR